MEGWAFSADTVEKLESRLDVFHGRLPGMGMYLFPIISHGYNQSIREQHGVIMPLNATLHLPIAEYYAEKWSLKLWSPTVIQTFKVERNNQHLEKYGAIERYRFYFTPTRMHEGKFSYPNFMCATVAAVNHAFAQAKPLEDGNIGVVISPDCESKNTLYLKFSSRGQLVGAKVVHHIPPPTSWECSSPARDKTIFTIHNPRPKNLRLLELEARARVKQSIKDKELAAEALGAAQRAKNDELESQFRF